MEMFHSKKQRLQSNGNTTASQSDCSGVLSQPDDFDSRLFAQERVGLSLVSKRVGEEREAVTVSPVD